MARATSVAVRNQLNRFVAGMVAGLAATGVMSLVMLGAKLVGALGEPPPRRLTRRLLSPLGVRPKGRALDVAALLAHAAYGAGVGGIFALLPGRFKTQSGGRLFGLGVWALNYSGVLPQLGLMPPARKDRFGRPTSMIVAHLAYGTALAAVERELYPISADLSGKVVVVCGGSRGLGRALAGELARRGARVAICGRAPEAVERAHRWLEEHGSAILADVCDLRDEAQTLISSIGGKLGIPHLVAYSSAKFAQVGFAEALGAEVAKDGVRVLTVAPGLMRTGSHVHATFRGQPERELIWFGASAIAPLVSIDAGRAARHIVRAIARGERYLTFTPAARLGSWLHDSTPNLWAFIASTAGRLLPDGRGPETSTTGYEGTEVIKNSSSRLVRWIAGGSAPLANKHGQ
jgi:NAD(P)-dependent dehydrogenase (short-subunit alcohol dehydrogenase family)